MMKAITLHYIPFKQQKSPTPLFQRDINPHRFIPNGNYMLNQQNLLNAVELTTYQIKDRKKHQALKLLQHLPRILVRRQKTDHT